MFHRSSLVLIALMVVFASAQFYSVENPDGSYSFGPDPNRHDGDVGSSVYDLLRKSGGWTADAKSYENHQESESRQQRGLLQPHVEILQLVQTFLRFKGEVASRAMSVVKDNYEIISSLYQTFIAKVGKIHNFTLTGIQIIRKVMEFAVTLMQQWHLPGAISSYLYGGQ